MKPFNREEDYAKFKSAYIQLYRQQAGELETKESWSEICRKFKVHHAPISVVLEEPLKPDESSIKAAYKRIEERRKEYGANKAKFAITPNTSLKSYDGRNPDLKSFKPVDLINELRARGYRGKLTYTHEIVL